MLVMWLHRHPHYIEDCGVVFTNVAYSGAHLQLYFRGSRATWAGYCSVPMDFPLVRMGETRSRSFCVFAMLGGIQRKISGGDIAQLLATL